MVKIPLTVFVPAFVATSALAVVLALLSGGESDRQPLLGHGSWLLPAGEIEPPELAGRWTLLAFFTPDQPACLADMPALDGFLGTYAGVGLRVVGITPVPMRSARDFLRQHPVAYPVLSEAAADVEAYRVREVPDSFLVDPDGAVVARGLEAIRERLGAGALSSIFAP